MKFNKKILTLLILFIFLFNINIQVYGYFAIYEKSQEETVSRGVTLTKITHFTYNGWQNINILKADLSDQYIQPDVITYGGTIKGATNVKAFVSAANCIAGINADFFNTTKNGTSPIGTVVNYGKVISTPSTEAQMGTLYFDNNKTAYMDYVTSRITLTAPSGYVHTIGHINKFTDLSRPVIYTREWGEKSLGSNNGIIEMAVENNIVTHMVMNEPPLFIPENGYVISFLKSYEEEILANFTEGDEVKLDINLSVDINDIYKAVGGGTMLVKDGQVASITHNISGIHPRTAAGTDKTGKILYLVTVDGRSSNARGMSLAELSEFLISKGIYNAINFDGGGSTTMVSRREASNALEVVNTPSDGGQRSVTNAIGIASHAPEGTLAGIKISSGDSNIFSGTSRILYADGYDEYHNPKYINPSDITWSVEGISGSFKDRKFYPVSAGDGVITARIGNATGKYSVKVFDKPYALVLNSSKYVLGGKTQNASLYGKDANGYRAAINLADVKWSVTNNVATMVSGAINPNQAGTGVLCVEFGDVKTYAFVDNNGGNGNGYIPQSTNLKDPKDNASIDASNTIAVFTNTVEQSTMLDRYVMNKLQYNINRDADYVIFTNGAAEKTLKSITPKIISINDGEGLKDFGIDIITLYNDGGSIKNIQGQWESFLSLCDTISNDSVVVFLSQPLNSFTDSKELVLFKEVLTEKLAGKGKDVIVFHKGGTDEIKQINNGVRYIGLTNVAQSMKKENVITYAPSMNYVLLFKDNNGLNYQIKNLFK